MRRRVLWAAALTVGAWTAVAPAAPAATVTVRVAAVSWWSRQPGAAAQPAGGFQIADGIDGAESAAAIRVEVPEAQGLKATLVLAEAASSIAPTAAGIRVCTTSGGWPAANPGPYAQLPKADCSHPVTLRRSGSPPQWTGDVTSMLPPATTVNLEIQPAVDAVAGHVASTYTVTLTKATISAQATAAPAGGAPATDAPAFVPTPSPSATDTVTVPAVPSGAVPLAPADSTPAATNAPVVTRPETASAGNPAPIASPNFTPQTFHHNRPWGRLVLFVPLAAVGGVVAARVRRLRSARTRLS